MALDHRVALNLIQPMVTLVLSREMIAFKWRTSAAKPVLLLESEKFSYSSVLSYRN